MRERSRAADRGPHLAHIPATLTEGRGSVTPCLYGLFDRLHPPHALAARCGIVVRRRILFPGRPFARPRSRAEMPGFFALAAETPILRAAWTRARRIQRSRTPCADRLGERTKRQRLGHVNVAPRRRPTASWLPHGRREARAPNPASGFSAHEMRDPTRLPRSRFEGSITRPTEPKDHHDRGACWGLSTFRTPGAPFRAENDHRPRSGSKAFTVARLCASWGLAAFPRTQRQDASKPLLQPTFTSRALAANTTFGDHPPTAVGNPPALDFGTVLGTRRLRQAVRERRRTTLRSSGLQRLRARRRDAGFGSIDCHARACAGGGRSAAALSAAGAPSIQTL